MSRSPRSRSRSPIFGRRGRSRSPSPIFRRRSLSPLFRRRGTWGRSLRIPAGYGPLHHGRLFFGPGYAYPLWLYNRVYYPWWVAYRLGYMDDELFQYYASQPGYLPPGTTVSPMEPREMLPSYKVMVSSVMACDVCGITSEQTQLHTCEGCHDAVYCGESCQKRDFDIHKEECL